MLIAESCTVRASFVPVELSVFDISIFLSVFIVMFYICCQS